jgi:hypothetical protein
MPTRTVYSTVQYSTVHSRYYSAQCRVHSTVQCTVYRHRLDEAMSCNLSWSARCQCYVLRESQVVLWPTCVQGLEGFTRGSLPCGCAGRAGAGACTPPSGLVKPPELQRERSIATGHSWHASRRRAAPRAAADGARGWHASGRRAASSHQYSRAGPGRQALGRTAASLGRQG